MVRVRAFQISGVKLWFWSSDHLPPHFHAKRGGEWEVRIHFLRDPKSMLETVWSRKNVGSVGKQLCSLAEEHREELLVEWETIHRN